MSSDDAMADAETQILTPDQEVAAVEAMIAEMGTPAAEQEEILNNVFQIHCCDLIETNAGIIQVRGSRKYWLVFPMGGPADASKPEIPLRQCVALDGIEYCPFCGMKCGHERSKLGGVSRMSLNPSVQFQVIALVKSGVLVANDTLITEAQARAAAQGK